MADSTQRDLDDIFGRLRNVETSFAEHHGKCEEIKKNQNRSIAEIKTDVKNHADRISELEKKVAKWSGVAAAAGAIAGSLVGKLL